MTLAVPKIARNRALSSGAKRRICGCPSSHSSQPWWRTMTYMHEGSFFTCMVASRSGPHGIVKSNRGSFPFTAFRVRMTMRREGRPWSARPKVWRLEMVATRNECWNRVGKTIDDASWLRFPGENARGTVSGGCVVYPARSTSSTCSLSSTSLNFTSMISRLLVGTCLPT